jgi:hypothetical protein
VEASDDDETRTTAAFASLDDADRESIPDLERSSSVAESETSEKAYVCDDCGWSALTRNKCKPLPSMSH